MNFRDIRTLTLLQAFDNNNHPTQRELAEKLDMSLGMINIYLKRMVMKSYLSIHVDPKSRVGYHLTPDGTAEKVRLSHDYIKYALGLYTQIKAKMLEILHVLEARNARTIAFLGANEIAEIAYVSLQDTSIDLIAVIDDEKPGTKFLGHVIVPSSLINNIRFDYLLDNRLLPSNADETAFNPLSIPKDIIITVFSDLLPV